MKTNGLLVIDIGKTNIKLSVLDFGGAAACSWSVANGINSGGDYPAYDVAGIWSWLLARMTDAAKLAMINHVCVATHGAAAAVVIPGGNPDSLALPIMDYEWQGVEEFNSEYDRIRPIFSETYSPSLAAGLNLGRQLYWQQKTYPEAFSQAEWILPYAQYWSWRLTDVASTEVSSLGSHTDLWRPEGNEFSSLLGALQWTEKMAPIRSAWSVLGPLREDLSVMTGIPSSCRVLAGVHDSNASFARFMYLPRTQRPTVISSGTWTITMAANSDLRRLDETRDMLANVDVEGAPFACARFMGGREFSRIAERVGAAGRGYCSPQDVQRVINQSAFALPDFSGGYGPFAHRESELVGDVEPDFALPALYAALMMDLELDLLGVNGPVVLDGPFAENDIICGVLSALRPSCEFFRMRAGDGIALGCLQLALWNTKDLHEAAVVNCLPLIIEGLDAYRERWRMMIKEKEGRQNA